MLLCLLALSLNFTTWPGSSRWTAFALAPEDVSTLAKALGALIRKFYLGAIGFVRLAGRLRAKATFTEGSAKEHIADRLW
jgi:hypothetical protein